MVLVLPDDAEVPDTVGSDAVAGVSVAVGDDAAPAVVAVVSDDPAHAVSTVTIPTTPINPIRLMPQVLSTRYFLAGDNIEPFLGLCQAAGMARRGRPQLHSDESILEAALDAFAALGYEAMSVRALNARLGLSHETITQRFGTKEELYYAAVRRGLEHFLADLSATLGRHPSPIDDLSTLRAMVRGFMVGASRRPAIGRLLVHEGLRDSDRLDFIATVGFESSMGELATLLQRLQHDGVIRPTTTRALFFLAEAGAAPFNRDALSRAFDPIDGHLDPEAYVDWVTEVIMRGLRPD